LLDSSCFFVETTVGSGDVTVRPSSATYLSTRYEPDTSLLLTGVSGLLMHEYWVTHHVPRAKNNRATFM
jgi:hypothetical protein